MRIWLHFLNGTSREGELVGRFDPDAEELVLQKEQEEQRIRTKELAWVELADDASPPKGLRAVEVVCADGKRIPARVLSLDAHEEGFFAWPPRGKGVRWFFYWRGVRRVEHPAKIGEILVSEGYLPKAAVDAGLRVQRRKLGEVLLDQGAIDEETLKRFLDAAKSGKKRLGEMLLAARVIDEETLLKALAAKFHLPIVDLAREKIDPEAALAVGEALVRKHEWLPLAMDDREVVVAVFDPTNTEAEDEFRFVTNRRLRLVLAAPSQIRAKIDEVFPPLQGDLAEEEIVIEHHEEGLQLDEAEAVRVSSERPIVGLVNRLIMQALSKRASDIHLMPGEKWMRVSYRIDGELREATKLRPELAPKVISRIKVLAEMDISEHLLPQDGRILVRWQNKAYELRVSVMPNIYGESAVIRVLARDEGVALSEMGFREEDRSRLVQLVHRPYGMILATGPTGSGKSTTLFALVKEALARPVHVITIEDPVEYRHPKLDQIQVHPKAGLSFARVLRNVLRHDPDVVLLGEIRDEETAEIALRAALTGHLLLSTLHTNTAADTVLRLVDMGLARYAIAEALLAISSQNLLRRLCPKCRQMQPVPNEARRLLTSMGLSVPERVWRAEGCEHCDGSGVRGRALLYELLVMTDRLREAVHDGIVGKELEAIAIEEGMVPKREHLVQLLSEGIVDWQEAKRFLL